MRTSPEGILSVTLLPSRAMTWHELPALLATAAPLPGTSSTAWTKSPSGICESGRQLPTVASALAPFITFIPGFKPSGARM